MRTLGFYLGVAFVVLCALLAPFCSLAAPTLTPNDVSLILAINTGDNSQAAALLRAGASANAYEAAWPNRTALMLAAWFDRLKVVEMLLARGADVNATDQLGETPLMWAIQDPLRDMRPIEMLLSHGANVNAADKRGRTVLMFAVAGLGVQAVLANGGATGRAVPFRFAPNPKVVRLLIEHKAAVNAMDQNGQTVLMQAAATGNMGIVKLLVQAGAQPDLADRAGHDAQWYASHAGHKAVAAYLAQSAIKR